MLFKRKRQLAQAMELITQFDAVLRTTVANFAEATEQWKSTMALLLEASQQRDRAIETADRVQKLLDAAIAERDALAATKGWRVWKNAVNDTAPQTAS